MRKFNIELNVSKLNTKKVQLSQIEARYKASQVETERLQSQFETKALEVSQLETAIKLAQSTPSVS
jgi:hypothetical protein